MADMGNLWIYDLWTVILGTIGMKTMWEGTDYWFIGHGNENPWISWGWLWMFVYLMDSSYYQLYNCWPSNKNWLNYMDGWFDFFSTNTRRPFLWELQQKLIRRGQLVGYGLFGMFHSCFWIQSQNYNLFYLFLKADNLACSPSQWSPPRLVYIFKGNNLFTFTCSFRKRFALQSIMCQRQKSTLGWHHWMISYWSLTCGDLMGFK